MDEDGNTVEEWTSTEEAHVIKELVVGKKYTLVETQPADGYVTAESIEFTVENTAEIQKHQMKDDVTKAEISKQDIAGRNFRVLNSQSWTRMERLWKAGLPQKSTLHRNASDRKIYAS